MCLPHKVMTYPIKKEPSCDDILPSCRNRLLQIARAAFERRILLRKCFELLRPTQTHMRLCGSERGSDLHAVARAQACFCVGQLGSAQAEDKVQVRHHRPPKDETPIQGQS